MNSAKKVSMSFALLAVAFCAGNREVQAQQQNQASAIDRQVQEGMDKCSRKYPDQVKQAIAIARCENEAMEPLRQASAYPDIIIMEMGESLVIAEKLQKGKMTLIEAGAASARLHSQVIGEIERRQLAKAAAARPAPAPAPSTIIVDQSPPPVFQSDAPQLQNNLPRQTRCQTMRVGITLQTVCN